MFRNFFYFFFGGGGGGGGAAIQPLEASFFCSYVASVKSRQNVAHYTASAGFKLILVSA